MTEASEQTSLDQAEQIIERFGGIRPMASKMLVPVTTVQGWKKRGVIPGNRRSDVFRAAQTNGIDLTGLTERQEETVSNSEFKPFGGFERTLEEVTASQVPPANDSAAATPDFSARESIVPPKSAVPSTPVANDIDSRIAAAEKRAVRKGAMMAALFSAIVGGLGFMLIMPMAEQNAERLNLAQEKITVLEKKLAATPAAGATATAVPGDVTQKMTALQNQVTELQGLMQQIQSSGAAGPDGEALERRLAALEANGPGDTAAAVPASVPVDSAGLPALFEKLRQLQQTPDGQLQLTSLARSLNTALTGQESAIEAALTAAQQKPDMLGETLKGIVPGDLKAAAFLVSTAQLNSSLSRSAPFDEDLQLIQKLMSAEPGAEPRASIDQLMQTAKQGVLTPEKLEEQFRTTAGEIVSASLNTTDATIKEKALARLNELVQVRKNGELVTGTDVQAKVARAQAMLEQRNIGGAIAELETLEGAAAEKAKPFLDLARMAVQAQGLKTTIGAKMKETLSAGASAGLQTVLPRL